MATTMTTTMATGDWRPEERLPPTREDLLEGDMRMLQGSIRALNDRIFALENLVVRIDEEDKAYLLLRYAGAVQDDEECVKKL